MYAFDMSTSALRQAAGKLQGVTTIIYTNYRTSDERVQRYLEGLQQRPSRSRRYARTKGRRPAICARWTPTADASRAGSPSIHSDRQHSGAGACRKCTRSDSGPMSRGAIAVVFIAIPCSGLHINSYDIHDSVQYRDGNSTDFDYQPEGSSQYLVGNTAGLPLRLDQCWSRGCNCAPPSDEAGVPKPSMKGNSEASRRTVSLGEVCLLYTSPSPRD